MFLCFKSKEMNFMLKESLVFFCDDKFGEGACHILEL